MKKKTHEPITLRELWLSLTVAAVCFALFHVSWIPTGAAIPFLVLGGIGRYVSRVRAGWLSGTLVGTFACMVATVLGGTALFAFNACFGPNMPIAYGYAVVAMIAATGLIGAIYGGRLAARDFGDACRFRVR